MAYTEEEITTFLELAQEQGITKTRRELGYPKSWATADKWAKSRQVNVAADEIKSRAALMRIVYNDEDVITIAQEGMNRVYEELVNTRALTADDQNKLGSALTKHYNVWANVQGRATSINESRQGDGMDAGLIELLNQERAKNQHDAQNNQEDKEKTN